jgi:hypothetical protein
MNLIPENYLLRAIEYVDMKMEGRCGVCEKCLACWNTILYECIFDLQIQMFLLLRLLVYLPSALPKNKYTLRVSHLPGKINITF